MIFQSARWHEVFRELPSALSGAGRAAVTAPGESEARLCRQWLREAGTERLWRAGQEEVDYPIVAENLKKTNRQESDQRDLIRRLSWEDATPA